MPNRFARPRGCPKKPRAGASTGFVTVSHVTPTVPPSARQNSPRPPAPLTRCCDNPFLVGNRESFQGSVLEAVLERITYANEDTGYTVARVDTGRGGDLVTVVGALLGAQPGESSKMRGRWGSHPQYGKQFHVEDYTTVLPATVQGVRRYLGSGLIKGIGPKLAERIVDFFGVDALDVIEQTPGRLIEVPNLGPKRTKLIA